MRRGTDHLRAPNSLVPTLTKMGEITSDLSVFEDLPEKVELRIELSSIMSRKDKYEK